MGLRLEVEYDNYDSDTDTYTPLRSHELPLKVLDKTIFPVSMFDNRHATYDLPEGATEEDLMDALEGSIWCYTGISDVTKDEPTP